MVKNASSFNPIYYPICLNRPKRIAPSGWLGHVPFGMLVIDLLRPSVVVELGTYYGVSFCSFCQAVHELRLDTRCFGIDTWRGDPHTAWIGADALSNLKQHHDPLYASFSTLVASTFDDALQTFTDGTIDLLHIDGFHTYEAVRHDFETWLPKLSDKGVVLFHDIAVKQKDFGVWKLWAELKAKYSSFEMQHCNGLGVLAVGPNYPPNLDSLLKASAEEQETIAEFLKRLGDQVELHADDQFTIQKQARTIIELQAVVNRFTSTAPFKLYHFLKYRGRT